MHLPTPRLRRRPHAPSPRPTARRRGPVPLAEGGCSEGAALLAELDGMAAEVQAACPDARPDARPAHDAPGVVGTRPHGW